MPLDIALNYRENQLTKLANTQVDDNFKAVADALVLLDTALSTLAGAVGGKAAASTVQDILTALALKQTAIGAVAGETPLEGAITTIKFVGAEVTLTEGLLTVDLSSIGGGSGGSGGGNTWANGWATGWTV